MSHDFNSKTRAIQLTFTIKEFEKIIKEAEILEFTRSDYCKCLFLIGRKSLRVEGTPELILARLEGFLNLILQDCDESYSFITDKFKQLKGG